MTGSIIPPLAAAAVVVGILPLPYAYYQLLRVLLCAACVYYVLRLGREADGLMVVLGGLALLYNPVVPVHLRSKPLWICINVATVACLFFAQNRNPRGPGVRR